MAESAGTEFTLQNFAKFSLVYTGFGGVSGGVVGGVGHYLLGFRRLTPLTGLVTGTVFGGLFVLTGVIIQLALEIIFGNACGLGDKDTRDFLTFGGAVILDFAVTPLVSGLIGFPIASYWQFLAQLVAQVALVGVLSNMCLAESS